MKTEPSGRKFFYLNQKPVTLISDTTTTSIVNCSHGPLYLTSTPELHTTFVAVDDNHSVLTTTTEEAREFHAYSPYGHSRPLSNFPIGYNGELRDERIGGYSLGQGFRFFIPRHARFNAPDTVPPFRILNYYAYCDNDPINALDPSGHAKFFKIVRYRETETIVFKTETTPSLLTHPDTRQQANTILEKGRYIESLNRNQAAQNEIGSLHRKLTQLNNDMDHAKSVSYGWKHEEKIKREIKATYKALFAAEGAAPTPIKHAGEIARGLEQSVSLGARELGLPAFEPGSNFTDYFSRINARLRRTHTTLPVTISPRFY